VLARQVVLVYDCRVEDCDLLDSLGARHDEECSMSEYLSRRWYRRSVDSSGSVLTWKKNVGSTRHESRPFLHHCLVCVRRACGRSSLLYVARKVASRWRDGRCGRSMLVVLDAKLVVRQRGGSW
jgi:hypothetical protein